MGAPGEPPGEVVADEVQAPAQEAILTVANCPGRLQTGANACLPLCLCKPLMDCSA